jgi:hypothetical protein
MNKNVGFPDRTVRIIVGLAMLCGALLVDRGALWLAVPGAVLVLTGVIENCPLYSLIGLNTRSTKPQS